MLLSLAFQRAIVRVCTTRKSCYVQKHSFLASAHFPCRLEEINMDVCLKGRLMRVSPASYGSQSWVGCYQGCTGGVGGQGAENWCVDEARKRARQHTGVPRCCEHLLQTSPEPATFREHIYSIKNEHMSSRRKLHCGVGQARQRLTLKCRSAYMKK